MQTVFIYPGSGRYTGESEFDWASPPPDSTHRFMLFLAQSDDRACQELALHEIESFGFTHIELGEGRLIDVESLNNPQMSVFRKHYEGAFTDGATLVWYP